MQAARKANKEKAMNESAGFSMPLALFLSVGSLGLWAFVSIVTWADVRRREREAYYKHETFKKLAEMPVEGGLALLREDEKQAWRRRREGMKLGGLTSAASGIGLMVFIYAMVPDRPGYLVGVIPLLIGIALLAYSYVLAPKE
jgi:hypothetical protein